MRSQIGMERHTTENKAHLLGLGGGGGPERRRHVTGGQRAHGWALRGAAATRLCCARPQRGKVGDHAGPAVMPMRARHPLRRVQLHRDSSNLWMGLRLAKARVRVGVYLAPFLTLILARVSPSEARTCGL